MCYVLWNLNSKFNHLACTKRNNNNFLFVCSVWIFGISAMNLVFVSLLVAVKLKRWICMNENLLSINWNFITAKEKNNDDKDFDGIWLERELRNIYWIQYIIPLDKISQLIELMLVTKNRKHMAYAIKSDWMHWIRSNRNNMIQMLIDFLLRFALIFCFFSIKIKLKKTNHLIVSKWNEEKGKSRFQIVKMKL